MNQIPVLPAADLPELRRVIAAIATKRSSIKLGQRSYGVLIDLANSPDTAAHSSINQLAKKFGVSASTLTRLATRLGYSGFNALQNIFRQHLAEPHFYSERAHQSQDQESDLLVQVAQEEIANIQQMMSQVSTDQWQQALELLQNARHVRTFAQRQFYSTATFFSYCLGLLRDGVGVLGDSGHGVPHGLAQLNHQDLLIVFGSHPYSRIAVDCCRQATAMEIPTIVFTDTHGAPMSSDANCLFTIPTNGSFFSNSTAAWVVLIEAILTAYARRLGPHAIKTLEHRERVFEQMQVAYS
ncbi:MurR/RpiR family transcriptional regulator [Candidatus Njordibacter sp. Uisw_056]|jgi:DNA-binding MurR/RpiR family transcriptional regulator|uniref:MurR/RpiR family transcriptional regulator n=1 Tax=Candidatus Njordibacter sp. Uisw_056 TaxID=3230973 RepID=UPI003D47D953|tara:strand:- start:27014 stop:27904 length:891 start_codon:yes stop_codon:yes gene_type:complete